MKTSAKRIALGLFIVSASLAASKAASAQSYVRWQNASTPNNSLFFMGVAGGPICGGNRCTYNPGTQIILWQWGQNDQNWTAAIPGPGHVVNLFGDFVSGTGWCLYPSGSTNNSNMVIKPCSTTSSIDNWRIISAESLGAWQFSGCFIFQNQLSFKVLSVYQGNVFNGARVIQYDLCQPGSNACGNPSNAFHADQFWCPWNV